MTEIPTKISPPQLSLYHYEGCYFCRLVRLELDKLGIKAELRDIQRNSTHLQELMGARGRRTVPVLRIESETNGETQWLPESSDIIEYLNQLSGNAQKKDSRSLKGVAPWLLVVGGFFLQDPLNIYSISAGLAWAFLR